MVWPLPPCRTCPRCSGWRGSRNSSGQSGLYGSHDIPDLCEPCFFDEEAETEERGTNNLPDTLARYRENVRFTRET